MVLDIEKMSLEEKLQAMEELWEDLRGHYEKKTPPQWHRKILEERERLLEEGEEEWLDWRAVRRELVGR